eukprot:350449-Rhodomonas_salina.1
MKVISSPPGPVVTICPLDLRKFPPSAYLQRLRVGEPEPPKRIEEDNNRDKGLHDVVESIAEERSKHRSLQALEETRR